MKGYLAISIVLGLQMSPLAAADKKEAPEPLPPEIIQTWRDAGANVGWMKWEDNGALKGLSFMLRKKARSRRRRCFSSPIGNKECL